MVNRDLLTESGKAAVIAALDPFHDTEITGLQGWPDAETTPSIVRRVAQSVTVKSAGDGGSIVIMTMPVLNEFTASLVTRRNFVFDDVVHATSTDTFFAPATIRTYTSAQTSTGWGVNAGSATLSYDVNFSLDEFTKGGYRVLGYGIEVHDVTADIYKQGTLTVSQINQVGCDDKATGFVRGYHEGASPVSIQASPITCRLIQNQYQNLNSMMLFPGTVQWEAKKGCYIVLPFTSSDNTLRRNEPIVPLLTAALNAVAADVTTAGVENSSTAYLGVPIVLPTNLNDPYVPSLNAWAPMHSKQIALTGLNANSTFTINSILYLEQFPMTTDPGLLTLARPSAPLDDMALEIISRATQELPIAVPVNENPMGEWFEDVVSTALEVIAPVAAVAFPEFAPLIGAGAKIVGNAIRPKKAKLEQAPRPGQSLPTVKQVQPAQSKKQSKKQRIAELERQLALARK